MTLKRCDSCGADNAKTYKYETPPFRAIFYIDLCVNCVQDWVLKNQKKLSEVTDGQQSSGRKVIFG